MQQISAEKSQSSRSLYLPRSPLIHVLAEVRFSPVLAMESRIPEIQDALRKQGFPLYERREVPVLHFDLKSNPSIASQPRWDFLNAERTLAVFLSTDFVVIHTTRFRVFNELRAHVATALDTIYRATGVGLVEQLGLRYINLVRPPAGEPTARFLNPGLLGIAIPEFRSPSHRYETIAFGPDESRVAVRCLQNFSGDYLPPDLANENLNHNVGISGEGYACILDLDHSMETRTAFDLPAMLDLLGRMHDNLDLVFRTAVTVHALEAWQKEAE
jgi:uncharacterized protein (TIGR04255 family)